MRGVILGLRLVLVVSLVVCGALVIGCKSGMSHLPTGVWVLDQANLPDVIRPTVVSVVPPNGATNVSSSTSIILTFSESIASSSLTSTNVSLLQGTSQIFGTISQNGSTITLTPSTALSLSTQYTVQVSDVADENNNALLATFTSTFTVASTNQVLPFIQKSFPSGGATQISKTTTVSVTFSTALDPVSVTESSFMLKDGAAVISGTRSVSGATMVFTPTALDDGKTYTVQIGPGIKDQAGNIKTDVTTFAFSIAPANATDTIKPFVVSVNPADGTTGVSLDSKVFITFSEAVATSSLLDGVVTLVENGITLTATSTISGPVVTMTPTAKLSTNRRYEVRVSTGLKDLAGNTMAANFVSVFSTMTALPNGYLTVGFPATSNTLSIPDFSSTMKAGLILVNTGSTLSSGFVGASLGNLNSLRPSENSLFNAEKTRSEPTKEQEFHNFLREFEKKSIRPTYSKTSPFQESRIERDLVGQNQSFFVTSYPDFEVTPVQSICVKSQVINGTGNTYFYVDASLQGDPNLQSFVDSLSQAWGGIYNTVRDKIGIEPISGNYSGVSLTNDITILIVDESTIGVGVGGYFSSNDLTPTPPYDAISNQRKIFYISYLPLQTTFQKGTLAHEFQHMVSYYQSKMLNGVSQEIWLNEAMSGFAEYLCGYGIESANGNSSKAAQVNTFFQAPGEDSLETWMGKDSDYGQVYLFGVWLAQKYAINNDMKSLLSSGKVGSESVAAFTKEEFAETLSKWLVALYFNDHKDSHSPFGIYGLNLHGTYSGVALTGPARTRVSYYPQSSPANVQPSAGLFIDYEDGTGNTLNLTLPAGFRCYEVHR